MHKNLSDWKLRKPSNITLFGEDVCDENYNVSGWIDAKIPVSLAGSLYEAGEMSDIYFGRNMFDTDGFKKEAKTHFSWHSMPKDSPYRYPFWYRCEFDIEDEDENRRFWLKFNGINFRAEIWLNGKRIASEIGCAGPYRIYDIDVTKWVNRTGKNILAVKVVAQRKDELGLTFIDWLPTPSDDSAGLWRGVELYSTGIVAIKEPFVNPILSNDLKTADINFSCKIVNNTAEKFTGKLKISLDEGAFTECYVECEKFDERIIEVKNLLFDENFLLWYPYDMGEQYLYTFFVCLENSIGDVIDSAEIEYAYRKIESKINEFGAREFWVNNEKILVRGAAYAPDILLRQDQTKEDTETDYIKLMNFNAVRLEGFLGSDNFWDLCDKKGILVFAGWPCCTHWERWEKWKPEDYYIAQESLKSQIIRLRNHASFTAWFYGSDFPPIPKVEKSYLNVLENYYPNLARISSAAKFSSVLTGASGVKMSGPYGFVPPAYWYDEEMPGVAHSFNTETSPDSSLPRYESVIKFLPENECFVGSPSWNFHCGVASFSDIEPTINGLEKRYGISRVHFKEFLKIGQIMGYECWRAMFEAYGRNFPDGSGIFGWMLNASWGKTFWQLFDYYLVPTGGFYGSQKACEGVHCQYSYDDDSIWLLNYDKKSDDISTIKCITQRLLFMSSYKKEVSVLISVYDKSSKLIYQEKFEKSVLKGHKIELSKLDFKKIKDDFFILKLDYSGKSNVYWLTKSKDEFKNESDSQSWFYRQQTIYADLSPILNMPKTDLNTDIKFLNDDNALICVKNTGKYFAAAVQLDFITPGGDLCYPVYFSENLFWLAPNESVEITAKISPHSRYSFDKLKLKCEALNA
ncbi:MAG: hypothetical protein LBH98_07165 [Chitinispirillales bacterium]|jgi:exo-1,4-beta-D-glucosaminidase|nr:hypothetical protein [Chitinispirillales bacterium]